jgi:hypothetical protein
MRKAFSEEASTLLTLIFSRHLKKLKQYLCVSTKEDLYSGTLEDSPYISSYFTLIL